MLTEPNSLLTAEPTDDLKQQIEAWLPPYYALRDRWVWWKRRQLWLDGAYPHEVLDAGRGQELLAKTRAYYHPDHAENP